MPSKATLQKREYMGNNGKKYTQYRTNIPLWVIEKLGWTGQSELEFIIKEGNLIAKKPKSRR
jgi:hypothetical protein